MSDETRSKTVFCISWFSSVCITSAEKALTIIECASFSENIDVTERTIEEGALSGVTGAAVGAIIGGKEGAKKIGGSAGILGAVEGNIEARYEQSKIIKNCLRGRGYKVLS